MTDDETQPKTIDDLFTKDEAESLRETFEDRLNEFEKQISDRPEFPSEDDTPIFDYDRVDEVVEGKVIGVLDHALNDECDDEECIGHQIRSMIGVEDEPVDDDDNAPVDEGEGTPDEPDDPPESDGSVEESESPEESPSGSSGDEYESIFGEVE